LLANDYTWRGQSQTNGATALQGSLSIGHESGAYLGVWASNVRLPWGLALGTTRTGSLV